MLLALGASVNARRTVPYIAACCVVLQRVVRRWISRSDRAAPDGCKAARRMAAKYPDDVDQAIMDEAHPPSSKHQDKSEGGKKRKKKRKNKHQHADDSSDDPPSPAAAVNADGDSDKL